MVMDLIGHERPDVVLMVGEFGGPCGRDARALAMMICELNRNGLAGDTLELGQ